MKKVSIIIPVYNTAQYLKRCLDSVRHQTYTNLEIICVDDGSTDGSQDIVDEYGRIDSRFIVIHQENGGESSARNTGLLKSTGDYIGFMDCDDWIEPNMYEILVDALESNYADIAACSWFKSFDDNEIEMINKKKVLEGVINQEQFMRYIYERDSYQGFAYMWDKLYKREVLTDQGHNILLFDNNIRLGGDVIYLAMAALNCNSAVYVPKAMYHYYQRNSSGCHTVDIDKRMDWLKSYCYVIDMFHNNNITEDVLNYVKRFLAYHSSNVAELAIEQNDVKNFLICQGIMKKYEKEYISLNQEYPDRITRYRDIEDREMHDI